MKILIATQGKSGSTALFYKLKTALPAETCCLFEPARFEPPAEGIPANVLAKIMVAMNPSAEAASFQDFEKKILIVRDPRDGLISRMLYRPYNDERVYSDAAKISAFVGMLRRKEADPRSVSVLSLIDLYRQLLGKERSPLTLAASLPLRMIEFCRSHHGYFFYRYEDFVAGRYAPLERYLGLSLSPEAVSLDATPFTRVTRTMKAGDWRNWFLAEDVEFFRPYFAPFMQLHGYADDWDLAAEPQICAAHSSEYVLRITAERRNSMEQDRPTLTG